MNYVFSTPLPITSYDVRRKSLDYSLFTWSPQKNLKTIEVKGAKGCYYWDYDEKKYFDLCSQLICVNIGHGNEKVINAIKAQAENLTFVKPKFTTDVRGCAAETIIRDFAPSNMAKVLFSLGGAESNEYAIRLAKVATGRTKIFSQYNSYHGATYGAANLCGDIDRNVSDPQIGGFIHFFGPDYKDDNLIRFDDPDREADFYLKMLDDQLRFEGPQKVAAIFLEAMTGGNSLTVPGKRYFQGVRKLCDKYGILLVVDEVMTGFGRTGRKFCVDYYDVQPDMITFAKGVTSAYVPLGGVILSKELSEYFDEVGVPIGCRYNSHPLACAAALANMEVIKEDALIENTFSMGCLIEERLSELKQRHPAMAEQRGLGLARGFMVHKSLKNRKHLGYMFEKYAELGFPTNGNNGIIIIAPPMIVTESQIDDIMDVTDRILSEMDSFVSI